MADSFNGTISVSVLDIILANDSKAEMLIGLQNV